MPGAQDRWEEAELPPKICAFEKAGLASSETCIGRERRLWRLSRALHRSSSARVLDFLDSDERDPLIAAIAIHPHSSAKQVCGKLRPHVFVIIEEALVESLAKNRACKQRVRRLPFCREQVGYIELVSCLRGALHLPRGEVFHAHHGERLLHIAEKGPRKFVRRRPGGQHASVGMTGQFVGRELMKD